MDRIVSRTFPDIYFALEYLEKQGDVSVTVANHIKALKFELMCARITSSLKHPLRESMRIWINLVKKQLIQPIKIGRMPGDLLEETMSGLLQIIDNCPTIDNIYKCLEELENQGNLTMHVENQIQNIKLELRNLRLHFKRRTFSYHIMAELRSWVNYVEKCLLLPTRKGCMTADLWEETLSDLLQRMMWMKRRCNGGICRIRNHEFPLEFDYTTALINDDVLEGIDALLDNLKHFRCNEINLVVIAKVNIVEKLEFLRNFFETAGIELEQVIKNGTPISGLLHKTSGDLLASIKRIIQNAMYMSWFSWDDEEHQLMNKFFFVLQANIDHIEPEIRMICAQLLKASKIADPRTLGIDLRALAVVDSLLDNLQQLLKDKDIDSYMHLDVHHIEILGQELRFLKYFLMDPHVKQHNETEAQSFNSLLMQVEAMARELGASLALSSCVGRTEDHQADEMNMHHSNLLKVVNLLKIKIRRMYLCIPRQSISNFPRCPKFGFVNFFIQSLEDLLQHRADSITYVKNEIRTLQSELTLLNYFVRDSTMNRGKNKNIASRIVDVAYEAERVVDLISASHFPKWYYILWLSDVIEKINILRKDCSEVHSKMTNESNKVENASSTNNPSRAYNLPTEEEMVGFQDEARKIIDKLTRGTEQLDIVSIVGMPGLGKTTLAKKVYEHPSITRYFHVRSWYCISQVYDKQDLFCSILEDLRRQRSCAKKDEDKAQELYISLKGMRYLIVLDDIWSIGTWNDIRDSFPDDCNGSRILFTSRIREVALQANPRSASLHDLRLFSNEESWELLQNKAFKQRSYHPKIYTIGKKIAENCRGLPLSVVLIAGVLVKLEESENHWKQVLASLGKQVVDLSKCILELSYNQLPDHLKPCFLYFGAFPEDKEISTWKLIRLWIAEGFIQKKTEYESLENVAEDYLMDLIARSLVLIAQNKSNGGVKSCYVHDLLHEFSIEKAKDENFLLISKEMPYDLEQYRHCFYCDKKSLIGWMPYDPYVRSVFFYPIIERCWFGCLLVLSYGLKLLRVLDLQRININNHQFQRLTELQVHLRYLAIQGPLDHVPSSVANLWRLETFILKGSVGEVKLPEVLFEMAYLKHIYVFECAVFELSYLPERSIISTCIEKLSTLHLDDCMLAKVMRRLRSLRKLKCNWYQNKGGRQFPVVDLLSDLESLNIKCCCSFSKVNLSEFSFPSNLKKLTLSYFRLPWSESSKIGRLPQLKVLKLLSEAFMGQRWEASDDEFRNLKFLKLEGLNIVGWDASLDAFPRLEQLVLQSCRRLEEIPSSFGESSTLQMIKVKECRNSITEAVLKIKEEQHDLGAAEFKVHIQHSFPQS